MTECLTQKVFLTLRNVVSHAHTDDINAYDGDDDNGGDFGDYGGDEDYGDAYDVDDDVFLSDYTNTGTSLSRVCPL